MIDVYILDENFRKVDLIDDYEELIWAERFHKEDDFELHTKNDANMQRRLYNGAYLSFGNSNRVYVVESVHRKGKLTFKGRGLDSILTIRAAFTKFAGSSKVLLNSVVKKTLVDGVYSPYDRVPGLKIGTEGIYPESTMFPSIDPVPNEQLGWNALSSLHEKACSDQRLGYRFVREENPTAGDWEMVPGTFTTVYSNYRYNAFPSAVKVANEEIRVFWNESADHYAAAISRQAISTDGGRSWTLGSTMATPEMTTGGVIRAIYHQPTNKVIAFMQANMTSVGSNRGYARISNDGGYTYGPAIQIDFGSGWVYSADMIHVDDGSQNGILFAVGYGDGGVVVSQSTNLGATWTKRPNITTLPWNQGPNETSLLHMGGTHLRAYMRIEPTITDIHIVRSDSYDMGATWTPFVYEEGLADMTGLPKTHRMPDGTLIMQLRDNATYALSSVKRPRAIWTFAIQKPGETDWTLKYPFGEMNTSLGMMMYGDMVFMEDGDALWIGAEQPRSSNTISTIRAQRLRRTPDYHRIRYDTYSGVDRTKNYTVRDYGVGVRGYNNTEVMEADEDALLFRNFAANPGFKNSYSMVANQQYKEMSTKDFAGEGCDVDIVDVEWSSSGRALQIESKGLADGSTSVNTFARPMWRWGSMARGFDNQPMWGKTFTIFGKIEIPQLMSGTSSSNPPTKISIVFVKSDNTEVVVKSSPSAPNSIGVHTVGVDFTFPAAGNAETYNRWHILLTNGSWQGGIVVRWSDIMITEIPKMYQFTRYFDGSYSPDVDMEPRWEGEEWRSQSALYGKRIRGVIDSKGAELIQSTQLPGKAISARLVATTYNEDSWVALKMDKSIRRFHYNATTKKTLLLPNASYFGRVQFPTVDNGTNLTNTPGKESKQISAIHRPQNRVMFRTGFQEVGGSIWFDSLEGHRTNDVPPVRHNNAVIFSHGSESYRVDESVNSIEAFRNVAYVSNLETARPVDRSYSQTMFRRRVALVDGDDVNPYAPNKNFQLDALGNKELDDKHVLFAISGEATPRSGYIYDVDYRLGDLVVVEDRDGRRQPMRVVEQLFTVNSENGYKSYPTLAIDPTADSGYWVSPEYNIPWGASDGFGSWEDQP